MLNESLRYEIMKSCWNFAPEERPDFVLLVKTISEELPKKPFIKRGSELYLSLQ